MADEPELKTATHQKVINPLMLTWAFVIILLSLTVVWITFSEDPEVPLPPVAAVEPGLESSPSDIVTDATVEIDSSSQETSSQISISESTPPQEISSISSVPKPIVDPAIEMLRETQTPLKKAPNENMLISGDNGMKPVLGPDGLIAWQEYARPFEGSEDTPRIAILITDIGLNTKSSDSAINDLPGQIDLALSPYGRNLQNWMDKARNKGHEAFLMIPTEPLNYPDNDPGPHTLIVDLGERDNLLRLDWLLSQVAGYVGVVNHMGSKFTASEEALTPILEDIHGRGLMLLDARSTRFSMAARIARRIGMPRALNDRYIDNVITSEEITRQLGELEKTAATFGAAVGLARATPRTVAELAQWSLTLKAKGIDLVPVSAIANRQPIK